MNLDLVNELARRGALKPGSAEFGAAFEQKSKRCILVRRARRARKTDDSIEILPWRTFLRQLWNDELPVS